MHAAIWEISNEASHTEKSQTFSHLAACIEITHSITEDGRSMTTFYYYSVNHQSGLQRNTFSKLSYIFLINQNVSQIMSFLLRNIMVS